MNVHIAIERIGAFVTRLFLLQISVAGMNPYQVATAAAADEEEAKRRRLASNSIGVDSTMAEMRMSIEEQVVDVLQGNLAQIVSGVVGGHLEPIRKTMEQITKDNQEMKQEMTELTKRVGAIEGKSEETDPWAVKRGPPSGDASGAVGWPLGGVALGFFGRLGFPTAARGEGPTDRSGWGASASTASEPRSRRLYEVSCRVVLGVGWRRCTPTSVVGSAS